MEENRLELLVKKAKIQPGGVDLKNRSFREFNYIKSFTGKDFVKWMKSNGIAGNEFHCEELG